MHLSLCTYQFKTNKNFDRFNFDYLVEKCQNFPVKIFVLYGITPRVTCGLSSEDALSTSRQNFPVKIFVLYGITPRVTCGLSLEDALSTSWA